MVNIFVFMLCMVSFLLNAMQNDSRALLEDIKLMQLHHKKTEDKKVVCNFDHILHLPIQSTKKQPHFIAQVMEDITESGGWKKLKQQNKNAYEHTQNSIIWTFVQLPGELQETIIGMMMGYDKDLEKDEKTVDEVVKQENYKKKIVADMFIKTPFLHAIDRWSKIGEIRENDEKLQDQDRSMLFVTMCPYAQPIQEKIWSDQKKSKITECVFTTFVSAPLGAIIIGGPIASICINCCGGMSSLSISGKLAVLFGIFLSPACPVCIGASVFRLYHDPSLAKSLCCLDGPMKYRELQRDESADTKTCSCWEMD